MRVIFQAICFMLNIHLIYISISPSPPCSCHSTLKENFLLDINWLVPLKHATGSVFLELVLSHSTNGSSKREISIEIDSLLHILQHHHHIAIFEKFFNFFKKLARRIMEKFLFAFPLEIGAYMAAAMTISINSLIIAANIKLLGYTSASSGNVYYNIANICAGLLLISGARWVRIFLRCLNF